MLNIDLLPGDGLDVDEDISKSVDFNLLTRSVFTGAAVADGNVGSGKGAAIVAFSIVMFVVFLSSCQTLADFLTTGEKFVLT